MGAAEFSAIALGKDPHEAFDKARKEALYWHGHGGYTGSIAEKSDFKYAGEVNSWYWDRLHIFFDREERRRNRKPQERLAGKPVPKAMQPTIEKFLDMYNDKWGPAICFQITGTKALEIKRERGRIESHDKVYLFVGWASS